MKSVKIGFLRAKTGEDLQAFFKKHDGKVEVVVPNKGAIPGRIMGLAERIVQEDGRVIKDRNGPTTR